MNRPVWRIVFLGTPQFAVPCLEALAGTGDEIVMVITQPDRPKGRGQALVAPPVKDLALKLGLPVWQPAGLRKSDDQARLRDLAPDLMVLVAYGNLLPPAVLGIPPLGVLNVHPSLLPKYRGPAPINWAIVQGETETGVTTMMLDEGVDTGDLVLSRRTAIGENETAGELHDRLSAIGADLLVESIRGLKSGGLAPFPQPGEGASKARLLAKEDGRIDWRLPGKRLADLVRGLDPWPGAYSTFRGQNVKFFRAAFGTDQGRPGGNLGLTPDGRLKIAAGDGCLIVSEIQMAGKKRMSAAEFSRGQRLGPEDGFGE